MTSSSESPWRIACATVLSRSGVALESAATTAERSGAPGIATSSNPVRPVSIDASAFCTDSWNVRPTAMASPTLFMAVVSSALAPGNFSKAKRGILVTT